MPLPAPALPIPANAAEWTPVRDKIRATLETLLGDLPPKLTPAVEILETRDEPAYTCERFRFHNGDEIIGEAAWVYGYFLVPKGLPGPAPLIIFHHSHGGKFTIGKKELWETYARGKTMADELVGMGFAVCAIDAIGFGERFGFGPDNPDEDEELSMSKRELWLGRTYWGMRLRDEGLALDYITTRPEIDPNRIGAIGFSMGSSRVWWQMALDERVKVGVAVCCLTRCQDLIETHHMRAHGIYIFVPGIMRHFDTEAVVALCAPRALLCVNGDIDVGSPISGINKITDDVTKVYTALGAPDNFRSVVYEGVGHTWTATMWEEAEAWLKRSLTRLA